MITADVPGVPAEELELTVDNGQLTIKGERKSEHEETKEGFRRIERSHGSFERRFAFPDNANVEAIEAVGSNGVVTVTIPKREAAKPKRIAIQ